jgi:hypothetical protein
MPIKPASGAVRVVTGEVASVEHAATSRNGNPTYRITLASGESLLTATDASCGYSATNYRPRRDEVSSVLLHLTRGGRIVRITRPDGADA